MNHNGLSSLTRAYRLLCAVGALAILASPAHAVLTNKYTFNERTTTVVDSEGDADGTVIDNTAISRFIGGALDISANNNAGSNQDFSNPATIGAFVDLPNGVFNSAVTSGTFGQVSLEIWATPQENRNWARLVDFGTSNGGENSSSGAPDQSYVLIVPQNGLGGANDQNVTASTHRQNADPVADEIFLFGGPALAAGRPGVKNDLHHLVFTLDQTDTTAGPWGTAKLYVNNGAPIVQPIVENLLLEQITDNNNWLGRAQWPDPLFDGTIDEFRIYNHTLTSGEVAANNAAGPTAAELPVLIIDRNTGAMTIDNKSGANVQVKGYSIASPIGTLNPAGAISIDASNAFDPDGTWSGPAPTIFSLAESVTGGVTDGGTLGPGASRGIGTPWVRTFMEDIEFTFTLGNDTTQRGEIQYLGTARPRSDLNGDGLVNLSDWAVFLPNSFTNFPSETPVGAYLKGDIDGDLDNDYLDFRLFKGDFVLANGPGSAALLTGFVPEPTTTFMLLGATITSLWIRRRRKIEEPQHLIGEVSMNRHVPVRQLNVLTLLAVLLLVAVVTPAANAALAGKYDAGLSVTTTGATVTQWASQVGTYNLTNNASPSLQTLGTPLGKNVIEFNGAQNDALAGPTAAPTGFPLAGSTALTVAVVFRPLAVTDNDAGNANFWGHPQLASSDQGGAAADWGFGWGPNASAVNNIWFGVGNNSGGGTPTVTASGANNNGRWYIGIGTWNGATGISAYLYDQNGALVNSNTIATPAATNARVDVGFATGAERPNLGGRSFDGNIAAIELYNNGVDAAGAAAIAASLHSAYIGGTPRIEVNTTSGEITLKNTSGNNLLLDYYEILSPQNALNPGTWSSLDDQNFAAVDSPSDPGTIPGDTPGEGFDEAAGVSTNRLTEYFLSKNGATLPIGASLSLGSVFNTSVVGGNNLAFNFGLPNGAIIPGDVAYVSGGVLGDYNNNGTVDAADYVLWRNGGPLQNESATPGSVTPEDYTFWRSRFGSTSGSGAAIGGAVVPEPATWISALFAAAALCDRRRKNASRLLTRMMRGGCDDDKSYTT
jgi:hypothetical protein